MATDATDRPDPVPNRSTTDRGFAIYDEFTDLYGREVRIQQSSSASVDAAWLFVGRDIPGDIGAAHLDAGMARRVVAALGVWLGEIEKGGEV